MNYLVCYDIANPRRLRRVAKVLENFGVRVQYSFFQCQIESRRLEQMKSQVLEEMEPKEDRLYIYPICGDCLQKPVIEGRGEVLLERSFEIL